MSKKPAWKQQSERSNVFWIVLLLRLGQLFGRPLARALLPIIVLYFVIFPAGAQIHSRNYLQRILQRPVRRRDVARHFHCFASTVLDRLLLFAGREQALEVEMAPNADFDALLNRGQGAVLLIAHIGSFDVLRLAAQQRADRPRLRVLMDLSRAAQMNAVLKSLNPALLSNIIDTSAYQGADLMLRIRDELQAGAVIGIMADRLQRPDERSVSVDFLGQPAPFPAFPWLIASVMQAPVFLGLGLYQGGRRYCLQFEQLCAGQTPVPRSQRQAQIQQQVQQYAGRLQHWLQRYPLNWFNFYDFWAAQSPAPDRSDATAS